LRKSLNITNKFWSWSWSWNWLEDRNRDDDDDGGGGGDGGGEGLFKTWSFCYIRVAVTEQILILNAFHKYRK
jgi:hypothetical protein